METNAADPAVEPVTAIAVTVTFSSATGPVTGTAETAGGASVPFHGWLELMDALEATRSAPPQFEDPQR
jgi:hypothetical protein